MRTGVIAKPVKSLLALVLAGLLLRPATQPF